MIDPAGRRIRLANLEAADYTAPALRAPRNPA